MILIMIKALEKMMNSKKSEKEIRKKAKKI